MKTLESVKLLREFAAVRVRDSLLTSVGIYFMASDDSGSVDDPESEEKAELLEVHMSVERWRENGRTMTDEGRAELAAEEAAEGDILAKAVELGFSDEVCGDGSGDNGPETLYLLKRSYVEEEQ